MNKYIYVRQKEIQEVGQKNTLEIYKMEKSVIAVHVWKQKHAINCNQFYQSILIVKTKDINFEILSADYLTKKLVLNPVDRSTSAPQNVNNYSSQSCVENEGEGL